MAHHLTSLPALQQGQDFNLDSEPMLFTIALYSGEQYLAWGAMTCWAASLGPGAQVYSPRTQESSRCLLQLYPRC